MATIRSWSVTLLTAVITAAVLLAAGWLVVRDTGDDGAEASQNAGTTPILPPALGTSPENIGPEGVPMPGGSALGPPRSPAKGEAAGGIPCGSGEQLTYHVHARLTLFVNGKPRAVPLGIGIGAPRTVEKTARGPFVSGGSCFAFLHTHASDGVIHIEAPGKARFTLGQFFDVWRERLDSRHLGSRTGRVVAYVNGERYRGNPRAIPLAKHAQIHLELGQPHRAPSIITFPKGL
jgi:hypothetical protein